MGNLFSKKEKCDLCEYAIKQKKNGGTPFVCTEHSKKYIKQTKANDKKNDLWRRRTR